MASYFTKFGKGKEFSLVDGNEEKYLPGRRLRTSLLVFVIRIRDQKLRKSSVITSKTHTSSSDLVCLYLSEKFCIVLLCLA